MCASCNVISQPENLIENRFFSKFLEDDISNTGEEDPKDAEEEKKCTNCSENAIATSWCVECEEMICQNCVMVRILICGSLIFWSAHQSMNAHQNLYSIGASKAKNNQGSHHKAQGGDCQ